MQSNNVDQTSNTHRELVLSLERSLGYAAATNSIWDLEQSQCILAFNCNVTEEHNVVAVPIKKAAKGSAKLVVIDPREVELTRYATLWLRPAPGAELLLLGAILRSLIDQGLERTEWVEENCESPATLVYALHNLDMEQASQATNVSQEQIAEAARLFAQAGSAAIVYALDNIPAARQRDCVQALTNLTLLTGNLGRPGSGLYPLRQGRQRAGSLGRGVLAGPLARIHRHCRRPGPRGPGVGLGVLAALCARHGHGVGPGCGGGRAPSGHVARRRRRKPGKRVLRRRRQGPGSAGGLGVPGGGRRFHGPGGPTSLRGPAQGRLCRKRRHLHQLGKAHSKT